MDTIKDNALREQGEVVYCNNDRRKHSRQSELAQLLQAAKTVLGLNAYNRPTPEELEILHHAIYQFEQAANTRPGETMPDAPMKEVTACDPVYLQFLTLRGWDDGGVNYHFEKKETVELTHPHGGDVDIRIPLGADLTCAAALLRAAATWVLEYRDFQNLERTELTAEQRAHNAEVQHAELPF